MSERRVLPLALTFLCLISCARRTGDSELRSDATVKDLMVSVVSPSATALWNAVWTVSTAEGISRKVPETEQEWAELRNRATALLDSIELLQDPSRRVAKPSEKSAKPGIEEEPEAIEEHIANDRARWIEFGRGMRDATEVVLASINARDALALNVAGDGLNLSCEACHKHYWYPREIRGDLPK